MSDPRGAVRRELRLIRRDARQPWRRWPTRVGGAIVAVARAAPRAVAEFLAELVGGILLAAASLGLLAVVVALVSWGWRHSPAAAVVLLAGIAGFLGYGGYELIARHRRRRGRLAAAAAGATAFTVFWALSVAMYYVG